LYQTILRMSKIQLDVPEKLHLRMKKLQLEMEIEGEKVSLKELYNQVLEKGLTLIESEKTSK